MDASASSSKNFSSTLCTNLHDPAATQERINPEKARTHTISLFAQGRTAIWLGMVIAVFGDSIFSDIVDAGVFI